MSELEELAEKVGDRFIEIAKEKIEGTWDDISDEGLAAFDAAVRDRAELMLRALDGEDVSEEMAFVDATIANWAWVGSEKARKAMVESAKEIASFIGSLLGAALKGKGIL